MARELELKLQVSSEAAGRALTLPWLRDLATGPIKSQKLVSVYFDTKKGKLRSHGLSLRVRQVDGKPVQTIKVEDPGRYGSFGRGEWEREIADNRPDLDAASDTALARLANRKLQRKLQPTFETVIERMSLPMRCDNATVEFALDRGVIQGGGRRQPVNEIEIEINQGDSSALAMLAERLAQSMPVSYGVRSKAERGYALCDGETRQPFHATPISLDATTTVGEAFTAIGVNCLKQVLANQEAVLAGDAEGVHQMRVGLRRLRAAISVFKRILSERETDRIKRELKWLTDELGAAREYEVLINEQVAPLRQAEPEIRELDSLHGGLQDRRKRAFEKAKSAVASDRFRELGLTAALWLTNGEWRRDNDPMTRARRERAATDFAAGELARRDKKILRKLDNLMELTPRQRHKLRIAIKKLRYSSDFFAGLFNHGKQHARRDAFKKQLKALQGALGTLNDIAMHRQVAQSIIHAGRDGEKTAEQAFGIGLVTGTERNQADVCFDRVRQAGRGLAAARPFWR